MKAREPSLPPCGGGAGEGGPEAQALARRGRAARSQHPTPFPLPTRGRGSFILFLLLALLLAAPASAESAVPIAEARWLAPSADALEALSTDPAECFAAPDDPDAARLAEIGRAAFRTPALLGGQAARAGLSCAGCHRNGRNNPAFAFPGVSGPPGTADVTSSFFSSHRGDGVANPVAIPDLAGPRAGLKVDRDPATGALESFIHGLVAEEFDGAEPPADVLPGLAAYVRALGPEACEGPARTPIRLETRIADAGRAIAAARAAFDAHEPETAALMLSESRAELGRIAERYPGEAFAPLRERLRAADRELAAAQAALRAGDGDLPARLAAWRLGFDDLADELAQAAPRSLFNRDVLSRALAD